MSTHYITSQPKFKHLTASERQLIATWYNQEGKSKREIARLLGKSDKAIRDELKKGTVSKRKPGRYERYYQLYDPRYAQDVHDRNKRKKGRKLKLTDDIKQYVETGIKGKYAPEILARQLPVHTKTIYNWLHAGSLDLTRKDMLYPRKYKADKTKPSIDRQKRYGQSIDERPASINQRKRIGDYEIDLVILTRKRGACLLTLTDRKTRHEIIRLIPNKTAKAVNQALRHIKRKYQILTITADNGSEFAKLSQVMGKKNVYYAHAYASSERGTNENHNRMIRRFLPKGTQKTTRYEVAKIEAWMNNYPRKLFNYKTPAQMMAGA